MPRYFMHIRDQYDLHEDETGMDLPDLHAALEEALRADRELTADPIGWYGLEYEITDESGRTLLKVPIQERRRNPSLRASSKAQHEHRRASDGKTRLLN